MTDRRHRKVTHNSIEIPPALSHVRPMPESENLVAASAPHSAEARKPAEPCSIVIFGASGDLTARKLIPALYHLFKEHQMPSAFRVIGFARREKTDDSWRQELRATRSINSPAPKPVDDAVWAAFSKNIFYCQGDLTEKAAYAKLEAHAEAPSGSRRCATTCFFISPRSRASSARWWSSCTTPRCCIRTERGGSGSSWRSPSVTISRRRAS